MARLVLVYLGKLNGVDAYGPLDAKDEKAINGHKTIVCETKAERCTRTTSQNKAMHKYFSMLADALNAAGWDMKRTLAKQAEIPWSELTVKEHLWKPLQRAMLKKDSTAKLETQEVSQVYETLNRHTSGKLGVSVPFPERHWQLYEQMDREAS